MGLHKNFGTAKKVINRVEKQPTKWKKIFANHNSDKGVIARILNIKLNHKNSN